MDGILSDFSSRLLRRSRRDKGHSPRRSHSAVAASERAPSRRSRSDISVRSPAARPQVPLLRPHQTCASSTSPSSPTASLDLITVLRVTCQSYLYCRLESILRRKKYDALVVSRFGLVNVDINAPRHDNPSTGTQRSRGSRDSGVGTSLL